MDLSGSFGTYFQLQFRFENGFKNGVVTGKQADFRKKVSEVFCFTEQEKNHVRYYE